MKKQVIKTMLWILAGFIWMGAHTLVVYLVEMKYSAKVAPSQVENDNAYAILRTHHALMTSIDYVYFAGFFVIAGLIIMTWLNRPKTTVSAN